MKPRRLVLLFIAALALAALLLASTCGDGGQPTATSTPTVTTAPTEAPTAPNDRDQFGDNLKAPVEREYHLPDPVPLPPKCKEAIQALAEADPYLLEDYAVDVLRFCERESLPPKCKEAIQALAEANPYLLEDYAVDVLRFCEEY